jgi:putative transposase
MATEYTYRFRVYPNKEQRPHLARTFGCARYVYNWGKELRTNAYHGDGESLSYTDTAKRLTKLKKDEDHEWLQEVSAVVLQQSLRNVEQAFTNFFEGHAESPTFKRKHNKRKHGRQAARYVGAAFDIRETEHGRKLRLSKMPGLLKVNGSRPMPETPTSCTITRDPAGRYHVCFAVKREIDDLPRTKQTVGIDLGRTDGVVPSDGWKSGTPRGTPRYLQKSERRLRKEQQKLSRKEKNGPNGPSNNWERQKKRVAKAHAKVADQRRDWINKLTTKRVEEYDLIVCETLAVQNMQRRAASAAPVKNGCLARAISDVGWGLVVRQLEYKAEW